MTDNPPKDKRLFVRLEDDDLAYVQAEAKLLGLDGSTWVRMMIRKLRMGQIGEHPQPALMRVVSTPLMHEPSYMAEAFEHPLPHGNVPDETLDTDDLVARKMREADQKGLTQPRAAQDDTDMGEEFAEFTGGIRPVGERRAWKTGQPKDFRPE